MLLFSSRPSSFMFSLRISVAAGRLSMSRAAKRRLPSGTPSASANAVVVFSLRPTRSSSSSAKTAVSIAAAAITACFLFVDDRRYNYRTLFDASSGRSQRLFCSSSGRMKCRTTPGRLRGPGGQMTTDDRDLELLKLRLGQRRRQFCDECLLLAL